ncbi:MAG: hypothetical protein PHC34_10330 [Candidatus Gastranaerophilales bacterium]|nr:hypothetical protein [Candidatus Gastranaerophilales bacterium]
MIQLIKQALLIESKGGIKLNIDKMDDYIQKKESPDLSNLKLDTVI